MGFASSRHSVGVRAGESRAQFRAFRRAIVVLCLACVRVSRYRLSAHGLRETGSVAKRWTDSAGRVEIATCYLPVVRVTTVARWR